MAAPEAVGAHYRGAQRWIEWYRDGGLHEVASRRMGGVGLPSFLSDEQESRLVSEVGIGRFRTASEIADWFESDYGVRFKGSSMCSALGRLGCSPKVQGSRHEKAYVKAQESCTEGD